MSIVYTVREGDTIYAGECPVATIVRISVIGVTVRIYDTLKLKCEVWNYGETNPENYPERQFRMHCNQDKILLPSLLGDIMPTKLNIGSDRMPSVRMSCKSKHNNIKFSVKEKAYRRH